MDLDPAAARSSRRAPRPGRRRGGSRWPGARPRRGSRRRDRSPGSRDGAGTRRARTAASSRRVRPWRRSRDPRKPRGSLSRSGVRPGHTVFVPDRQPASSVGLGRRLARALVTAGSDEAAGEAVLAEVARDLGVASRCSGSSIPARACCIAPATGRPRTTWRSSGRSSGGSPSPRASGFRGVCSSPARLRGSRTSARRNFPRAGARPARRRAVGRRRPAGLARRRAGRDGVLRGRGRAERRAAGSRDPGGGAARGVPRGQQHRGPAARQRGGQRVDRASRAGLHRHDGPPRARMLDFNPAAEATFGYSREEATGSLLAELIIPPEFRDAHRLALEAYVRERTPAHPRQAPGDVGPARGRLDLPHRAHRHAAGHARAAGLRRLHARHHRAPSGGGPAGRPARARAGRARPRDRRRAGDARGRAGASAQPAATAPAGHRRASSSAPRTARARRAGRSAGDFYDVFQLAPGRWAFAIGDVCGKGPRAAALTGTSPLRPATCRRARRTRRAPSSPPSTTSSCATETATSAPLIFASVDLRGDAANVRWPSAATRCRCWLAAAEPSRPSGGRARCSATSRRCARRRSRSSCGAPTCSSSTPTGSPRRGPSGGGSGSRASPRCCPRSPTTPRSASSSSSTTPWPGSAPQARPTTSRCWRWQPSG